MPTTAPPAVRAEALSKHYRVYARPVDRLLEAFGGRQRHREKRALEDVSFTVPAGQSLGIIGENGAGKSTLLKLLAGVTTPTSGVLETNGRIASILELGTGFHADLSGAHNVALNAALLGLDASEVRASVPAIRDFSELGPAFDEPVKTYSTGMAMRLAFAIATQVRPRILIVDEALSVGDGYFQKKCMDHLLEFVSAGNTLLFCSHAMYYVSAFCEEALWLESGRMAAFGSARAVVDDYEAFLTAKTAAPAAVPQEPPGASPVGPARIVRAALLDPAGRPASAEHPAVVRHGGTLRVEVSWEGDDPAREFHLGIGINRVDELEILSCSTLRDGLRPFTGCSHHQVVFEVPELPIVKGDFTVYVFLLDGAGLHIYDQAILRRAFRVESESYAFGLVDVEHSWRQL
jgi:lipopolysaccharide transport system ATP-binding protein